jgi:hypothetical protein
MPASSLAFLIPFVVALYLEKHVVSASMMVLVATSIANRQFGALKTLDRVLVRAITIAYANDALRNQMYFCVLFPIAAILVCVNMKCKMDHVLMHAIGCCGFTLYAICN